MRILTVVFIAVSALATAFMAVFNYRLVGVSGEMAQAAKGSAEAAEAALHLNRPAIVVTFVNPRVSVHSRTRRPQTLTGYSPDIYNLGAGPAEITGVFTHTQVFDAFDDLIQAVDEPRASDLIWDAESNRIEFTRSILAPRESVSNYVGVFCPVMNWTDDDLEKVETGLMRRAVYGLIQYRSSVKEYWTRFFYWWDPERRILRRAKRPELNERA